MIEGSGVIARLTARGRYAVAAMVMLAREPGVRMSTKDISDIEGIPSRFLESILTDLRKAGLVASRRGPSGGFWLLVDPEACSVARILEAMPPGDPSETHGDGVLATAIHARLDKSIRECLGSMSLADLIQGTKQAR